MAYPPNHPINVLYQCLGMSETEAQMINELLSKEWNKIETVKDRQIPYPFLVAIGGEINTTRYAFYAGAKYMLEILVPYQTFMEHKMKQNANSNTAE